jgi:octaheme c-type cytochrome (tetrathionate reductase family)
MKVRISNRVVALLFGALLAVAVPSAGTAIEHSVFIQDSFQSGPEVTAKCLECHEKAAADLMKTTHWTWSAKQQINGKAVDRGKKNTINNYCVSIYANWQRCTSCHAGYGWKDNSFDFNDQTRVDCLVCHDTTGTYQKAPAGAGMPSDKVNLLQVAQSVGKPNLVNCGTCHFYGGGGDAVKHGDLDSSMEFPEKDIDIHMALDGNAMRCQDCHTTRDHFIKGHSMAVSPVGKDHIGCENCHSESPHQQSIINRHTATVACQTCHIPTYAKQVPTKMSWDWASAGQDRPVEKDQYGQPLYSKAKGAVTWGKNMTPVYKWYNGEAGAYQLGDKINPSKVTELSYPLGSIKDKKARIYPFKVHTGTQIYDRQYSYFITPQTFGKEGFWTTFDWAKAAENGMKASGLAYSGEYGFAPTAMYWRLNHMVAPANQALTCLDCHGDSGRLNWQELGYKGDPMGNHKWARSQ